MTDAEFVEAVRTKPITEVLGVRCLILAIRDRDRLVALARQQLADAEARLIWWRDRWTSEQARVRELEKTLDNAAELKKIAACAARPLGDAMTSPQFRGGRGAARDPQSPASRSGTPARRAPGPGVRGGVWGAGVGGGMKEQAMTLDRHERCECGCCRCVHVSGFMECSRCDGCIRYTWPGRDAKVRLVRPHRHEKTAR